PIRRTSAPQTTPFRCQGAFIGVASRSGDEPAATIASSRPENLSPPHQPRLLSPHPPATKRGCKRAIGGGRPGGRQSCRPGQAGEASPPPGRGACLNLMPRAGTVALAHRARRTTREERPSRRRQGPAAVGISTTPHAPPVNAETPGRWARLGLSPAAATLSAPYGLPVEAEPRPAASPRGAGLPQT